MTESPVAAPAKKKGRGIEFLVLAIVIAGVIAAAAFQETIAAFFRLQKYNSAAPGKVVIELLQAMKAGDKAKATELMSARNYTAVEKGGKFVGFHMASMAGEMEFLAEDLIGGSEPKVVSTSYNDLGGFAQVEVTDAKGEPVKYNVSMTDKGFRVSEILSGRPVGR